MKDKWTQQFQEKLDGYEAAAPELEWAELDKALAKNRRPPMVIVWGRRIAAAAAVALLVIGGARVLLTVNEETPRQNLGERWLSHRQKGLPQGGGEGLTVDNEAEEMPLLTKAATRKRELVKSETDEIIKAQGQPQLALADVPQTTVTSQRGEEESISEETRNVRPMPTTARKRDAARKKSVEMTANRSKYHGGELTAVVYMQNAMTANQERVMMDYLSSPVASIPYGSVSEEFRGGTLDFLAASNPKDVRYDHDRPIKVGLGVKYNIDNRWSITSGLTYSYLRSTFDYSEGKMSGNGVQKLHYVGLPIATSYNVISAKKLKVYLAAGGEMQKLVSGRAVMDGVNIPDEAKKRDVKEGGMQWSLNAAVGAEYNIVDNFGIYVEPGVSHYIDNKSSVENFYKYKPTNFSLNVGLRLSIR